MKSSVLGFALLSLLTAFATGCSDDAANGDSQSGASTPGASTPAGGARFFLPTGQVDNTSAPTIVVDAQDATHAIYPAYAKGGAYYAYCGAGCSGPDATKVVKLETDGTVTNAMLALDTQDRPRVLLSAASKIYYATCDASCGDQASWTVSMILDHGGDREVSGKAFALDRDGRPRFLMHTYRTYLGIGQKDPVTAWVACDASCESAASWKTSQMQTVLQESNDLRFDANGVAKVAGVQQGKAVYQECAGDCGDLESWHGIALGDAFSSEYDVVSLKPTAVMALTKAGHPRVAFIARNDAGNREIRYLSCDTDCANDHWTATVMSNNAHISAGLDLALTDSDNPRVAYNLDYNIAIATCDGDCTANGAPWGLTPVEKGSDIPADEIFLYTNCNVGGWFFHDPSLALTKSGEYRVGYQARDMSAGWSNQDYTQAGCSAGTDMTWSRLAMVGK